MDVSPLIALTEALKDLWDARSAEQEAMRMLLQAVTQNDASTIKVSQHAEWCKYNQGEPMHRMMQAQPNQWLAVWLICAHKKRSQKLMKRSS